MSREAPPFAGFSGCARWKGPDARKRCSLLALWVQVIGAMAELERSLIAERVRAGLRNAKAKGKRLGRPCVMADRLQITSLRADGMSWAKIAAKLNIGEGNVYRLAQESAKIPTNSLSVSRCEQAAD
jgi:DNA invertase Pin-like site-specific DNA recombinase